MRNTRPDVRRPTISADRPGTVVPRFASGACWRRELRQAIAPTVTSTTRRAAATAAATKSSNRPDSRWATKARNTWSGLGVDDPHVDNLGPRVVARCRERQHDDPASPGDVLELLLDTADRRSSGPQRLQIPQVPLIGNVALPQLIGFGEGMIATQRDQATLGRAGSDAGPAP